MYTMEKEVCSFKICILCEAAGDVIDYLPSLNLNLISLCINQLDVKAGEQ